MSFKNTEIFREFLEDILNEKALEYLDFAFRDWLEDVAICYGESGCSSFEVSGLYTKSGNPECISFDVEVDGDEDQYFTTIIF